MLDSSDFAYCCAPGISYSPSFSTLFYPPSLSEKPTVYTLMPRLQAPNGFDISTRRLKILIHHARTRGVTQRTGDRFSRFATNGELFIYLAIGGQFMTYQVLDPVQVIHICA